MYIKKLYTGALMVNYNPKSNFVKDKIKKTKWKDRDRIKKRLDLEEHALGKRPCGFADAMYIHNIRESHENDYLAILKELDPIKYTRYLKAKKKEETEQKVAEIKYKKQEKTERMAERKSWQHAGGKL